MTDQNNHQGGPAGDPLGLVSRLVEAWADPDLSLLNHGAKDAGSAADIAAYELAAAVGWSRLAGVNPEETHNHVMSPEIIKAAAREQIKRSHLLVEAVKTAGTTWDAADSQFEKDEIICSVLEGRMDAWAADVAIEEACVADGITGEQFAVLAPLADEATDAVQDFDDALFEERALFSVVLDTNLLSNWRIALAAMSQDQLPWWLDGTLEEEAEKISRQSMAMSPGSREWAEIRKAADARDKLSDTDAASPYRIGRSAWLPELSRTLMAAADRTDAQPLKGLTWRRPDGQVEAFMGLQERYREDDALNVSFMRTTDGGFAEEMAGIEVTLAGVRETVDQRGQARFVYADLAAGEPQPTLRVAGVIWNLVQGE